MILPLPPLVRAWRAALPLVVLALFTPGAAKAECGDYVKILNAPAGSGRHHAPPANPDPSAADEAPAPAKPPCHGPNCSGSPTREAPPMVPAPTTGPHLKQPARLLEPTPGLDSEPGYSFASDFTSATPVSFADSIFHPPRRG